MFTTSSSYTYDKSDKRKIVFLKQKNKNTYHACLGAFRMTVSFLQYLEKTGLWIQIKNQQRTGLHRPTSNVQIIGPDCQL